MAFDPHPLIVHFPIALLSFYAVLEIARFKILASQSWYFFVKAVLVMAGCAGAGLALITGNLAAGNDPVVRLHSYFAYSASITFGIIAFLYILAWFSYSSDRTIFRKIRSFVESWIMAIPAGIGLVFLLATGALGAVIVYGPGIDPVAGWIHSLFF